MAAGSAPLVDEGPMTISPDGSDITKRYIVRDSDGLALTYRNVYDYAAATFPTGSTLTDFDGLSVYKYQLNKLGSDTHGFAWVLDVEYRSRSFGPLNPLPWNDAPEWSIEARTFEKPFFKDATTPTPKDVVNSVGDPFEEMPTSLAVECEMRYTRNEQPGGSRYSLIRDQVISQNDRPVYCNTDQYTIGRINGSSGLVVPAKRSIMWIESVRRLTRDSVAYVEVTYGFRFYPLTPADEIKIDNYGYNYYKVANTPPAEPIFGAKGEVTRFPKRINLDGTLFTGGGEPPQVTFKRPVRLVPFAPYSFV